MRCLVLCDTSCRGFYKTWKETVFSSPIPASKVIEVLDHIHLTDV
jgi:hypothetical protein